MLLGGGSLWYRLTKRFDVGVGVTAKFQIVVKLMMVHISHEVGFTPNPITRLLVP